MIIRSIRRLTSEPRHYMCTGAKWFHGELFVAYREGDAHVCPFGKLIVRRSRDQGLTFETVHVARGEVDTRDAHFVAVGEQRLYLVGFEEAPDVNITGTCWTENGMNWSAWTRFRGADRWWLWHPEYYQGRFYCAGYGNWDRPGFSSVAWFESDDGVNWQQQYVVHEGADQPNEVSLAFAHDGTALMLMRREHRSKKPLLLRAAPPYRAWEKTELDVPLAGPTLWLVGEDVFIAGRWFLQPMVAHQAIFKLVDDRPVLQVVLPSGPQPDLGYMSVAQWPTNRRRFAMAYYSNHVAPDDPNVSQWNHPAIYLADVLFDAAFIARWRVSDVLPAPRGLDDAACPNPEAAPAQWREMTANPDDVDEWAAPGLVDAHLLINHRLGIIYFVTDLEVGPTDGGFLHLGYDGPVRVWVNGEQVFTGPGTNPAVADQTSVPIRTRHGTNRLAIALDTNGGRAWGIMARYEPA